MARTKRQDRAWYMRHCLGWTQRQIGRRLGIRKSAVSRLLWRAAAHEGLVRSTRVPLPKRRTIRPLSLSNVHNA